MPTPKRKINFADEAPNGHGSEDNNSDDYRESLDKDPARTAYALGEEDPDKAAQELLNIIQGKPYGTPQPPPLKMDY
jgi:hypothetical protein